MGTVYELRVEREAENSDVGVIASHLFQLEERGRFVVLHSSETGRYIFTNLSNRNIWILKEGVDIELLVECMDTETYKIKPGDGPVLARVETEESIPEDKEMVDHPQHYNTGNIEVIDAIEDWKLGFSDGNVVKYTARAKYKGKELEDLKKALWFLERHIKDVESR